MKKIKNVFTNHKKYLFLGLVVILAILYFAFKGDAKQELYTVAKADVTQSVVLSGKVQTSNRADLGFASSGRLGNIYVKNNQQVSAGTTLAQLEVGDLLADLKIKQANVRTSGVDLEAAADEVDRVTKQEDTKVESAYRALLSKDLTLTPSDTDYAVSAPAVSGIYDGAEGQYKITIDRDPTNSSKFILRIFGLERIINSVNEKSTTPIGTRGLYLSFGADVQDYLNTTWLLDIPNKASASYLTNYNAYNEAKKNRDLAVQDAQFKYKKLLTEGDSEMATVAQAELQKVNAEIRKNTIYAPFAGKVTNIEKEVGENASVGERVISILGEDKLEVVLQVSELDVSRIPANAPIKLTLDAFPNEEFIGTLKTINSRETTVDGVPVYEAFVELPADPRIKTGMSSNGTIVLATKAAVLAIPSYLINKEGDTNTVEVLNGKGKVEKRTITLGLTGTDSMVEIVSGLSEGDQIVAKAK